VRPWNPKTAATVKVTLFHAPVGMELWTYRHQLEKDLGGTLAEIRRLGFRDVETASFYGRSAEEFHKLLQQNDLTCTSLIVDYKRLQGDLEGVTLDAKTLGATYVFTSSMPRQGDLTIDDVPKAAAAFNGWGSKLKEQGRRFGYHPHGFEFVHTPKETLFDVLMEETKPEYVTIELDAFWFVGRCPLDILLESAHTHLECLLGTEMIVSICCRAHLTCSFCALCF